MRTWKVPIDDENRSNMNSSQTLSERASRQHGSIWIWDSGLELTLSVDIHHQISCPRSEEVAVDGITTTQHQPVLVFPNISHRMHQISSNKPRQTPDATVG